MPDVNTATGLPIRVTESFLKRHAAAVSKKLRSIWDTRGYQPTPIEEAAICTYIRWKGDLRAATLDAEEQAFTSNDYHALKVAAILREAYESTLPS